MKYGILVTLVAAFFQASNVHLSAAIVVTDEAKTMAADVLKQWVIEKGNCWFYGNTGNHICDQIQKGEHRKMHVCAMVNLVYPHIYCDPTTDPNCRSEPPSQDAVDEAVEIAKHINMLGSGDLQFDQEVSKVGLELVIQAELDGASPMTFLRTALVCSHDFAKELYDDVNKCDDNDELQRQYNNIVHMIRIDDLTGCNKQCEDVSLNLC